MAIGWLLGDALAPSYLPIKILITSSFVLPVSTNSQFCLPKP